MLRIPAPTVQDRAKQWSDAYNAAEALFSKAFKDCPELICTVGDVSFDLACELIAVKQAVPVHIAAAAALTAANDLYEQCCNPV